MRELLVPESVLTFGKYKWRKALDVLGMDPHYLIWCDKNYTTVSPTMLAWAYNMLRRDSNVFFKRKKFDSILGNTLDRDAFRLANLHFNEFKCAKTAGIHTFFTMLDVRKAINVEKVKYRKNYEDKNMTITTNQQDDTKDNILFNISKQQEERAVLLIRKDYKFVKVNILNSISFEDDTKIYPKQYLYKIPLSMTDSLQKGSKLIVPVGSANCSNISIKLAEVVSVEESNDMVIAQNTGISFKWIIGNIELESYENNIKLDSAIGKEIAIAQQKALHNSLLNSLEEAMSSEDFKRIQNLGNSSIPKVIEEQ